MKKIMFVCHGNICRSPMAEFIFKNMLEENNMSDEFYVVSSATSSEEIWNGVGNPVYPPAKAILAHHGISCKGKHAVQLKKEDYEKYDMFIAMDRNNIRNISRIFGYDPDKKVSLLMDYTSRKGDVADPWYSDDFETAYNDIYEGCTGLLEYLKNNTAHTK
jgi:protein-tyrosine phosphatase